MIVKLKYQFLLLYFLSGIFGSFGENNSPKFREDVIEQEKKEELRAGLERIQSLMDKLKQKKEASKLSNDSSTISTGKNIPGGKKVLGHYKCCNISVNVTDTKILRTVPEGPKY